MFVSRVVCVVSLLPLCFFVSVSTSCVSIGCSVVCSWLSLLLCVSISSSCVGIGCCGVLVVVVFNFFRCYLIAFGIVVWVFRHVYVYVRFAGWCYFGYELWAYVWEVRC